VELLRLPRSLQDVLDLTPAPDLDVLAALSALLSKDVARVVADDSGDGPGPLLGPAEAHALRTLSLRQRGSTPRLAVAKVLLCGGAPSVRSYLEEVLASNDPAVELLPLRSGFGTVARVMISEALRVDLCVLPPADAAQPLWRPFSVGLVGGLLLESGEGAVRLAQLLARHRLPVASAGLDLPEALEGSPVLHALASEALRALLTRAVQPAQIELPSPRAVA